MTRKIIEWISPLEAFGFIKSKSQYLSQDATSETLMNAAISGGVSFFGAPDNSFVSRKIDPAELRQCQPIDVSGNLYLKNPPMFHTASYAFTDLKIDMNALEQYIDTLPSSVRKFSLHVADKPKHKELYYEYFKKKALDFKDGGEWPQGNSKDEENPFREFMANKGYKYQRQHYESAYKKIRDKLKPFGATKRQKNKIEEARLFFSKSRQDHGDRFLEEFLKD